MTRQTEEMDENVSGDRRAIERDNEKMIMNEKKVKETTGGWNMNE